MSCFCLQAAFKTPPASPRGSLDQRAASTGKNWESFKMEDRTLIFQVSCLHCKCMSLALPSSRHLKSPTQLVTTGSWRLCSLLMSLFNDVLFVLFWMFACLPAHYCSLYCAASHYLLVIMNSDSVSIAFVIIALFTITSSWVAQLSLDIITMLLLPQTLCPEDLHRKQHMPFACGRNQLWLLLMFQNRHHNHEFARHPGLARIAAAACKSLPSFGQLTTRINCANHVNSAEGHTFMQPYVATSHMKAQSQKPLCKHRHHQSCVGYQGSELAQSVHADYCCCFRTAISGCFWVQRLPL